MAGYVPNYQKKNRIFAKREQELLHAIKHGCPRQTLLKLAEKLRAAKIAVFKSRFAATTLMEPHKFDPHDMALHNRQVQRWISMAADEILDLYFCGSKLDQAANNSVATRTPLAFATDISMVNPYQSPPSPCSLSPKHGQVCAFVLAVVMLNVALNARNMVRNWSELTLVHHFFGILLWLVLPLLAVLLLWRARTVGRWILVGLFGLRALVGLLMILSPPYSVMISRHPGLLLEEPCRTWVLDTLFYFSATVWLFASPGIRQVCGGFHRRTRFGDTANPQPQSGSPFDGAGPGEMVD